jgi:peptidyl-prolyl cis-trans isomerase SurA
MRGLLAIGAAALLTLALCAAAPAGEVNQVVAVVGDDVITSLDVDRMVRTMEAQMGTGQPLSPERREQLREVALDRLIEDTLFQQEVRRLGIQVGEEEVDRYIKRIKERNNISDKQFASQLSRRGITPEEYRDELKRDMLKHRLISREVKRSVVISDEMVQEFYEKQKEQFRQEDKISIRALFLTVPEDAGEAAREAVRRQAQDLRQKAEAQDNLAALAKEHSQGPGAGQGGELGPLSAADLLPAMRQALAGLKPGQLSPVLEIPGGFVFFELLDRSGADVAELASVKEDIRQKLESEALEKKFQEWMSELRKKTFVKVVNRP